MYFSQELLGCKHERGLSGQQQHDAGKLRDANKQRRDQRDVLQLRQPETTAGGVSSERSRKQGPSIRYKKDHSKDRI